MLEVFGDATGNTRRVTIAIEEAGLTYTPRRVSLASGEHRKAPYLEVNPTGRVPTLIDSEGPGGERLVLTQSNAILIYIAEKTSRLLAGPGEAARARALEWLFFFVTDVIAPSHQAFFLRNSGEGTMAEDAASLIDARALTMFRHVDQQLAGRPFLAGDAFSLADIAGFTIASAYASKVTWSSLSNVKRWFDVVAARPAVQRGMTSFS